MCLSSKYILIKIDAFVRIELDGGGSSGDGDGGTLLVIP